MIRIPRGIFDRVVAHCRQAYPQEACGILGGVGDRVESFYPAENIDHSPVSFAVDSREQIRILKELRTRGQSQVGIIHSHVASVPYPSQKDRQLALDPGMLYVIVSLADPEAPAAKAYRINEGTVTEVPMELL